MKESFKFRIIVCVLPLLAAGALAGVAWKNTTAEVSDAPLTEEERKKEAGKLRFIAGIDLAGGTTLEYEVDRVWWERQVRETNGAIVDTFKSSDLASALKRRVDPNNLMETTIRKVGEQTATDPPRVEVILPLKAGKGGRGAADLATIKDRISQQGRLEFRILADNREPDDQEAIRLAQETLKDYKVTTQNRLNPPPKPQSGGEDFQTPTARYEWVELEETKDRTGRPYGEVVDRQYGQTIWAEAEKKAVTNPNPPPPGFQIEPPAKPNEFGQLRDNPYRHQAVYHATSKEEMEAIGDQDGDGRLDPARGEQPKSRHFVLTKIMLDRDGSLVPPDKEGRAAAIEVTGEDLSRVNPYQDPSSMRLVVQFSLRTSGDANRAAADKRFEALTKPGKDHPNERALAIILDGRVISAPHLKTQLSDGGIITMGSSSGAETKRRVDTLVLLLTSGQLPAVLNPDPVSEETIDPTLGAQAAEQGSIAVAIAFGAVVVFMLFYYRFAGLVASVALFANLLLTIGFMVMVKASFTLSGMAGLVLMLGMAVDANVLIYERIREERERGASIALAIRNGYDRAFPTIIDTHLTSIFTSIVLYIVGNDQLKGFGVSLTAGLIISLFTSLYMTRLLFDIFLQRGWLKELRMLKLLSKPNINFMRWRYHWFFATVTLSALGLMVFIARGERGLNIDLTGGSEYVVQFTSPQSREEVQHKLEVHLAQKGVPLDVSVYHGPSSDRLMFRGRFLGDDAQKRGDARKPLQQAVEEAFGPLLVYLEAKPGAIEPAASAAIRGTNRYRVELTFSDKGEPVIAPDQVRQAVNQWFIEHKPKEGAPHHYFAITGVGEGKNNLYPAVAVLFSIPDELRPIKGSGTPEDQALAKQIAARTAAMQAAGELGNRAALFGAGPAALAAAPPPGPSQEELADLSAFVAHIAQDLHQPRTDRLKSVGSSLADRTQLKAFYAIGLSWLAICMYLWFRFGNWTFGLSAVLCLVHDVTFAIGLIGITHWIAGTPPGDWLLVEDFKVDLPAIAALLTLVGYSVNDTIVVFDRIREVRGKNPELTPQMINDSVNQTLSRTLLTSFIVFLVVIVLYILGGEGVHLFSFVMVVGVIIGTYSSIFVASPLLLWLGEGRQAAPVRGKAVAQEAAV